VSDLLVSVEYHGTQWVLLVEQGWVTATVDTLPNGTRVARMIYSPGITRCGGKSRAGSYRGAL
jgi:hypothetical protein